MSPLDVPRPRILAIGLVIVLAAGCSSGDDDPPEASVPATEGADPAVVSTSVDPQPGTDPPGTDPPGTDPSVTEAPAPRDLSFLWVDVAEMVDVWNEADETGIELAVDDLAVAPLASAGDGFASLDVFSAGFLSGTIDPGGEVSALVVTVDPADESARSAVSTALGALIQTWGSADPPIDGTGFLVTTGEAYDELAGALVGGEQRFVPGPVGLSYVAVLSVVDESEGPTVIEVAVIPLPDEQAALAIVELLRLELRAVTG